MGKAICDNNNDLFIYGIGGGDGLPVASPSGYYSDYNGCDTKTFILELDSQQNLIWSTLFGSTPSCTQSVFEAGGMALDINSNLYVSGGIFGSNYQDSLPDFPIIYEQGATNNSAFQNGAAWTQNISTDAFISKFQTVNVPTGIIQIPSKSNQQYLLSYPNPSDGKFTVDLTTFIGDKQVDVLDQLGRTVFSEKTNLNQIQIAASGLSMGIYFVHVTDNSINRTAKIIIK